MNTSTGPNAVCAEAAANAAGSVTPESLLRAAYLAGQSVLVPAAPMDTGIKPGQFTNANSSSEIDRVTGLALAPSTDDTSVWMGSMGNHPSCTFAGVAGE